MELKCVECEKEAVYVSNGFSVCKEHLKELKEQTAEIAEKTKMIMGKAMENFANMRGEV